MGDERVSGSEPVSVQVRFERFPLALRGAFVMRGADGDPHTVRVESCAVARVPAGPAKSIPMEDRLIDLAPTRDLFVPFEVTVTDLEPSWYRVGCTLRVDGARSCEFLGRPFTVPWPRGEVRKGTIAVGRTVPLGRGEARIERIECGWESSVVIWRAPEDLARDVEAVVLADGLALETLPPARSRRLELRRRRESAGRSGTRSPRRAGTWRWSCGAVSSS